MRIGWRCRLENSSVKIGFMTKFIFINENFCDRRLVPDDEWFWQERVPALPALKVFEPQGQFSPFLPIKRINYERRVFVVNNTKIDVFVANEISNDEALKRLIDFLRPA